MSARRCDAHFGESDRRCTREAGHSQPLHTIPGEISWPDTLVMRRTTTLHRSGELFAGVGGLGIAVNEVFDAEPAWFAEFDAAPSKVLEHHYPDAPNYGDVTKVDFRKVAHTSIRCGGFPCQDVSLAGRRRGMTGGTRSGLWSEFARSIEQDRPDWVVIENVRGLLSADASSDLEPCPLCVGDNPEHVLRALGAVLGDLADLGFDAEWIGLRAADIGAPHGRFRVFILAWPRERTVADADDRAGHRERAREVSRERGAQPGLTLLPTPDAYAGSRGGSQHPDKKRAGSHMVTLQDVAEFTLLPTPVAQPSGNTPEDHLRKKPGREVVTDLAIIAENGLIEFGGRLMPTPRASRGGSATETMYGLGAERVDDERPQGQVVANVTDWGPYAAAIARWEQVVGRSAPAPVRMDGKGGKARLNPELTEWMMGWPAGWVTNPEIGLSRAEQLKACGNGVVPQQAAAALRAMLARPGVPALVEPMAVAS
ncbi:MAG: DNA cytosine methyltransferase [Microbacterium sp.]